MNKLNNQIISYTRYVDNTFIIYNGKFIQTNRENEKKIYEWYKQFKQFSKIATGIVYNKYIIEFIKLPYIS